MIAIASWEFWAPVLTSTGLVGVVGGTLAPWYRGWIEKGIQHRFDRQLEELRAGFRVEEERLRARLRAQEDQLSTLRSGVLAQLSDRQVALNRRKLEAIERLWAAVVAMAPRRGLMRMTDVLNMDELLVRAEKGHDAPKIREFGKMLWDASEAGTAGAGNSATEGERPFVDPLSWALFQAYRTTVGIPVAYILAVQSGSGPAMLAPATTMLAPLIEALPEHASHTRTRGLNGLSFVAEKLEEKLLQQLRDDLEGRASDEPTVVRAASILRSADRAAAAETVNVPEIPSDLIIEKSNVGS